MVSSTDLARRRQVALEVAAEAAELLTHFRGRLTDVAWKGAVDLVTEADKASEALIVRRLAAAFPDDLVVAEEGGGAGPAGAPFLWYVDPLDGTTNFVHGLPHFAVSLGVVWRGEGGSAPSLERPRPVVGVVHAPALTPVGERPGEVLGTAWSAAEGQGASRGGVAAVPIHVSKIETLQRALVATGFPYDRLAHGHELAARVAKALEHCLCIRRLGSASLDLVHVADGTFGAYWEPRLKPWDLAAGVAIAREAGGRVTDLSGGESFLETGDVLATNGVLHETFLREVLGVGAVGARSASGAA